MPVMGKKKHGRVLQQTLIHSLKAGEDADATASPTTYVMSKMLEAGKAE